MTTDVTVSSLFWLASSAVYTADAVFLNMGYFDMRTRNRPGFNVLKPKLCESAAVFSHLYRFNVGQMSGHLNKYLS